MLSWGAQLDQPWFLLFSKNLQTLVSSLMFSLFTEVMGLLLKKQKKANRPQRELAYSFPHRQPACSGIIVITEMALPLRLGWFSPQALVLPQYLTELTGIKMPSWGSRWSRWLGQKAEVRTHVCPSPCSSAPGGWVVGFLWGLL